jgi:hypothetical protein
VSLKEKQGAFTGKVEEVLVEQDESGATLARVSDTKDFTVTPASRARYSKEGVSWIFSMPVKPGAVKITIMVRDSASGRLGSLTVPLK